MLKPLRASIQLERRKKNQRLRELRGIALENIVFHIQAGHLLGILEHAHPERYPGRRVFVVNVDGYAWLVPLVEDEDGIFLKTIVPSRKIRVPAFTEKKRRHEAAAQNTLRKNKRVNIRMSERDLVCLQRKAEEEGPPYQTLISGVLHKYINGRLQER